MTYDTKYLIEMVYEYDIFAGSRNTPRRTVARELGDEIQVDVQSSHTTTAEATD